MAFPIQAQLMDYLVLAIVHRGDTYGYELTQTLMSLINVSESSLYPVLHRLKAANYLRTYDKEIDGRNRRYYSMTTEGERMLVKLSGDWQEFKDGIDSIVG